MHGFARAEDAAVGEAESRKPRAARITAADIPAKRFCNVGAVLERKPCEVGTLGAKCGGGRLLFTLPAAGRFEVSTSVRIGFRGFQHGAVFCQKNGFKTGCGFPVSEIRCKEIQCAARRGLGDHCDIGDENAFRGIGDGFGLPVLHACAGELNLIEPGPASHDGFREVKRCEARFARTLGIDFAELSAPRRSRDPAVRRNRLHHIPAVGGE